MSRKPSGKQRYNFLIDSQIYEDFSAICEDQGLVRSKAVEKYLLKFVEEHSNELKEIKKRLGN